MWHIAKLIPWFLLLGYDQAALGAVRNNTANLDAIWKQYLAADARKTPT